MGIFRAIDNPWRLWLRQPWNIMPQMKRTSGVTRLARHPLVECVGLLQFGKFRFIAGVTQLDIADFAYQGCALGQEILDKGPDMRLLK